MTKNVDDWNVPEGTTFEIHEEGVYKGTMIDVMPPQVKLDFNGEARPFTRFAAALLNEDGTVWVYTPKAEPIKGHEKAFLMKKYMVPFYGSLVEAKKHRPAEMIGQDVKIMISHSEPDSQGRIWMRTESVKPGDVHVEAPEEYVRYHEREGWKQDMTVEEDGVPV